MLNDLPPSLQFRQFVFREAPCDETRPEVFDGLPGRVYHILSVKAVIAEFIEDYLIGREIVGPVGEAGGHFIDSQKQCALAELIAMCSVFQVPDGGDREYEFFVRIAGYSPGEEQGCF